MTTLHRGEVPRSGVSVGPSVVSPIRARVSYLCPATQVPVSYLYEPPAGTPRDNSTYEPQVIDVHDCRPVADRLSVDRQGFELCDAPTRVANFLDDTEVARSYYPELAALARAVTGATGAYVFDHLVRKRERSRGLAGFGQRSRGGHADAAGRVHNDFTEASGRRRLAMVLNDPRAEAAVTRFCIVTLWRPITLYPVLDAPLAICDAGSVAADDLVASEIRYRDRTGEIYLVTHRPEQRWWYVPAMARNEILVFKQYDSAAGVAKFTPHAAFDHPDAPPDAPPRQSIEVRCLLTY